MYAHEYVYVTRRPYDLNSEQPKNLFCLGGKGLPIEDTSSYSKEHGYHTDIRTEYEKFMSNTFNPNPLDDTIPHQEKFFWHGLMGYTADGIRLVGFEPTAHALMYNLGCNGIGIMPAIWGGKRIANLLNGDTTKSLFDPRHM